MRTTIPFHAIPVHMTHSERVEFERTERKTIEQLKEEINFMLQSISEEPVKEAFRDAWYCEVLREKAAQRRTMWPFMKKSVFTWTTRLIISLP